MTGNHGSQNAGQHDDAVLLMLDCGCLGQQNGDGPDVHVCRLTVATAGKYLFTETTRERDVDAQQHRELIGLRDRRDGQEKGIRRRGLEETEQKECEANNCGCCSCCSCQDAMDAQRH